MKRNALGKGLRSLIPGAPTQSSPTTQGPRTGSGFLQIDVDRIRPNRDQPRRAFDPQTLEELARSVKRQGILQPVVVRPVPDGFELVAGERRWRAAQLAGLLKIPAIVRETADAVLLEVALIENLQREDLNPLEAASAFRALIDELGLTQQEVADRVGKQRTSVANSLRLLALPEEVQLLIREGKVSMGHARALASLGSSTAQIELGQRIVRDGLSVRQVETIVARASRPAEVAVTRTKGAARDPNVAAAEETLQRALKTRVKIVQGKSGGRIELHFFSSEELGRVYDLILAGARSTEGRS